MPVLAKFKNAKDVIDKQETIKKALARKKVPTDETDGFLGEIKSKKSKIKQALIDHAMRDKAVVLAEKKHTITSDEYKKAVQKATLTAPMEVSTNGKRLALSIGNKICIP